MPGKGPLKHDRGWQSGSKVLARCSTRGRWSACLVWQAQMLVEVLSIGQHLVQGLPGRVVVGAGDRELLHLLKLVHPAQAQHCMPLQDACVWAWA